MLAHESNSPQADMPVHRHIILTLGRPVIALARLPFSKQKSLNATKKMLEVTWRKESFEKPHPDQMDKNVFPYYTKLTTHFDPL